MFEGIYRSYFDILGIRLPLTLISFSKNSQPSTTPPPNTTAAKKKGGGGRKVGGEGAAATATPVPLDLEADSAQAKDDSTPTSSPTPSPLSPALATPSPDPPTATSPATRLPVSAEVEECRSRLECLLMDQGDPATALSLVLPLLFIRATGHAIIMPGWSYVWRCYAGPS